MTHTTPHSSFLTPPSFRDTSRRGATLLVTLGILTVLSVMAVAFLLTARLQRQTSDSRQNRLVARNYMDEGLYQAVRQIEAALTYPNYTDSSIPGGAYLTQQRLAPVGPWLSRKHAQEIGQDEDITFQAPDVLASMALTNAPTVNLLSPQVMRFVPSVLTNGLRLSASDTMPFRSGWIPTESLTDNASVEAQLRSKRGRIAFTVFNCSGFIDANTFASGPTTQKLQRVCFNQADVTNWLAEARTTPKFSELNSILGTEDSPFFHLSYDPDPDIYPLHYDCFETCTAVGLNRFGAYPVINLNTPGYYHALGVLKENATYWKFNLNAFKHHLDRAGPLSGTPWFNDAAFKMEWLDAVVFLLEMMRHEEPTTTRHRWSDSSSLAWTIANFMDEDRIPQVSDFPTADAPETALATRANYAVEDVPLINKVTVFNIYDDEEVIKAPKNVDPGYYDLPSSGLSNIYAVAVELWYPFAPKAPPNDSACYVGIYTNAEDVTTTTNLPWTQDQLRDWLNWDNVGTSNSVMQALFSSWARAYTNQIGPSIASHPLWQTVTEQSGLWFTPAMTNHPSWPVADTNGAFSIADTPIWQAFYPATYESVTTNETGLVTTNVYTYLNVTNSFVEWVSEPDLSTNRLVGQAGTWEPEPYPILLWTNLTSSVLVTNVLGAILTPDDTLIPFASPGGTNRLYAIDASPEGIVVVVSNELAGVVSTNQAAAFVLASGNTNGPIFALATNLTVTTEITPVTPLPMPEDLGQSLAVLFALLPTNSLASLNDFLMLRPDQFTDSDWNQLFDSFSTNPSIINRLLPSRQAPTLGNMTEEDRHALWTVPEPKFVELDDTKLTADQFQGYFWTVYPKQTVSFKEITEVKPPDGAPATDAEYQTVTNYHALGSSAPTGKPNTIWIRPAVTIRQESTDSATGEAALNDVIVDEALLTYNNDNPVPVWGWTAVTNLCIPDPRNNAYAKDWRPFYERWENVINTTNLNTDVSELPFIHFNTPFTTIGDIGHIYAAYEPSTNSLSFGERDYDTLTFSTRAGAALLDLFTISPTNGPKRGLVQANTQQRSVVKTLLHDVKVGWTNDIDDANSLRSLTAIDVQLNGLSDVYADALTNAPYSMGWRSFADMMPNLSTNRVLAQQNIWGSTAGLHPMHDYTEDVLRGFIDKVSFRQNIFVVIIAAQALSPASTETHPIVLADQRAAVTVLRDAYTGKWLVQNWVWLTE